MLAYANKRVTICENIRVQMLVSWICDVVCYCVCCSVLCREYTLSINPSNFDVFEAFVLSSHRAFRARMCLLVVVS